MAGSTSPQAPDTTSISLTLEQLRTIAQRNLSQIEKDIQQEAAEEAQRRKEAEIYVRHKTKTKARSRPMDGGGPVPEAKAPRLRTAEGISQKANW